jgi:hypothetical protein
MLFELCLINFFNYSMIDEKIDCWCNVRIHMRNVHPIQPFFSQRR